MIAHRYEVDRDVFRRYAGISLPRHVSYPMPTWWHDMDETEARAMHRDAAAQTPGHDLSLYVHIPFCETLCKFCACNKVVQRKGSEGATERTERYVQALVREIRSLSETVDRRRPMQQVHYGGGTPTYLSEDQLTRVHGAIRDGFNIAADAEVAMEIDPRTVTPEKLRCLRSLGFNRMSMGVQDFDEQVQHHVRRYQPLDMVRSVVATCRELQFDSVNFDLIYGMPYQTVDTMRETVEQSIALSPDRVAYYHYAQIPDKIATQRGMDYTKLPTSEEKLDMFLVGLELFERAGYEFIGLDHFAKSEESLAAALQDGTIQRNFQGMTTGGGLRLLAVGVSSISHLTDIGFVQSVKEVDRYLEAVEADRMPVERGKRFTVDDRVRQTVVNQLYCTGEVRPGVIESLFGIDFADYFARELEIMRELESDGLVTLDREGTVRVTCPLGRVLLRNVAAAFDAYLAPDAYRVGEQACFSANA